MARDLPDFAAPAKFTNRICTWKFMQTFKHRPITFAADAAPLWFYDNFTVIFHRRGYFPYLWSRCIDTSAGRELCSLAIRALGSFPIRRSFDSQRINRFVPGMNLVIRNYWLQPGNYASETRIARRWNFDADPDSEFTIDSEKENVRCKESILNPWTFWIRYSR